MTKAEFLAALKADNPVIDKVGTPVLTNVQNFNDNLYTVNVRKIKNNKINYENIGFVVVKEGLAGEAAYFYQRNVIMFKNAQEDGEITEI